MIALKTVTLTRLRLFALAAMAAATLGVASFASAPPASAMAYTCTEGRELWHTYYHTARQWESLGNSAMATYYYNLASFVAENTFCL